MQLRLEKRWPALSWSETTVEAAGTRWFVRWQGVETALPQLRALDVEVRRQKRSRAAGHPAHPGDAAMITKMRGFTLIETLLALAILAVLSAAAVMVLQNVIRADGLTREKSQQIAALQRAFRQIADDVTHIIPRRARNSDTFSSPDVSSCRATTGDWPSAAAAGQTRWGSSRARRSRTSATVCASSSLSV